MRKSPILNTGILVILFLLATLSACSKTPVEDLDGTPTVVDDSAPNILFVIADDLGKDALSGFTEGKIKPSTPNIDAIKNNGLSFTNLWVNPVCTPTRAAIITGKYGYSTGIKGVGDQLKSTEETLQKHISQETNNKYASALIGKWHLSGSINTTNPETFGIDYYSGLIRGAVTDYYDWQLTEDGVVSTKTNYPTEYFTDLSIDWIKNQTKPWFLWLAYNAPHTPFHVPPSNMHKQGNLRSYTNNLDPIPYFMAAIEAMDFQIGRLIESIPVDKRANTIIIFIGDNGTPNQVAQSPYTSATVKNTLFQGGVNTPMYISGKGVTRKGVDNNLITGTDLFATIAQIAGSTKTEINDSKSFQSLFTASKTIRNYQYSEFVDGANDQWAISNGAYKLIINSTGNVKMYDLASDPYESKDLMSASLSSQAASAKSALETELAKIRK